MSDLSEKKVGDMTATEFAQLMSAVLNHRKEGGASTLMELSVEEFTRTMLKALTSQSFATAQQEVEVSTRILTDWKGLGDVQAVANPFRISSVADLDEFYNSLRASFTPSSRVSFAVAVAVVGQTEGGAPTYKKVSFP